MSANFDLLGDPIPDGWGKRGRPPHVATEKNRNKVMMLLALGWNNERIAAALSITAPTLRKNYFRELKVREAARDRLDASLATMLWTSATEGNVAAMKEFRKLVERNDIMKGQNDFIGAQQSRPAPAQPRMGKKEEATQAAETAGQNTGWGDDLTLN